VEELPDIVFVKASKLSQVGIFETLYVICPPSGSVIVDGGIVKLKRVFVHDFYKSGGKVTIGRDATQISKFSELFNPTGSIAL